jgi:iron complex outermembrane receptor protein
LAAPNAISGGGSGREVKLGVNVPVGDQVAVRVVGYSDLTGGFIDAIQPDASIRQNVNDGSKTGVRAALRFEPSDRFSITPRVVAQRVQTNGWNRQDAFNILANRDPFQ